MVAGETTGMTDEYEIVRYRPAHKSQVAKLQTHLWSSDSNLAARYLEWKYEQNPYTKEPVIYLAFHRGELVGMRGFYPSRWELGSPRETHSILVADDAVIVPSHRNRRLSTVIMRAAFEDLAKDGHEYVLNLRQSRYGRQFTGHGMEERWTARAYQSGNRIELCPARPEAAAAHVVRAQVCRK